MKKPHLIMLIMIIFSPAVFCASGAIDSSYTYDYTQPPEFQPSFKSQFTSLSNSVTDVYANPAGILHVNTLEVAIGASSFVTNPIGDDENTLYVDDADMGGIENSPNSRALVRLSDDRTAITAEPRPVALNEEYSKGGGINYFGMTYRISDWLAFSISRKRPTAMSIDYNVLAPIMLDVQANFRDTFLSTNEALDAIKINNNGSVEVYVAGALTGTSTVSAWDGFLEQGTSEVNWMNGTFDNSIVNQNSLVITTAVKTGQVSWGLNIMPETIDIELNNEVYIMSDANNSHLKYYMPNLAFDSTFEALSWITYECSQPSGYRSIEVETLPGEQIGSAKIAGKYSASLVRMDLGMQWEPSDYFSFGAVNENFNGATVNLEGVNIVQYVQHRIDTNMHFPTMESEGTFVDPFLATPTHEVETEETIRNVLTMQPIELPRKLKYGMALKKPLIIAVDIEQWLNEYQFSSDPSRPELAHNITLKDITFVKLGMESQIFILPMIIRGSITGLLRPNTDDPAIEASLDDLYASVPVIPVDGNIYLGFGVLDGEFGLGVGGGGLPLIRAVMLDMSSFAKVFYTNVYFKKGDWQISYLMTMDPILTGFSSNVSTTPGVDSEIKLMQTSTLSIGYKF